MMAERNFSIMAESLVIDQNPEQQHCERTTRSLFSNFYSVCECACECDKLKRNIYTGIWWFYFLV
jgi:hypothetical protein